MEVLYPRCAGLDVGKDEVVASLRVTEGARPQVTTRTFRTYTASLATLAEWLEAERVTHVVMEATGQYWKPIWYALEARGFELLLVNARHVKILPGRKTDVGDATWLAELFSHGLLRGSFVPPEAIRVLRDLTRYRKRMIEARTSEIQRIAKTCTEAGIRLNSVASNPLGASGRAMLRALLAGERDPAVLAELAKGRLRRKLPELEQALAGRFTAHHAVLVRLALEHLEQLEAMIAALDAEVDAAIAPFAHARDLLDTIPGIDTRAAETILGEIGADMTVFPDAAHLASWAGLAPGNNVTGGKRRSGKRRPGDRWLSGILVECAWSAARTRDTYLAAQFWHLARRIGKKKAAVAVAHTILVIVWHLLSRNCTYQELGGDWFGQRDAERARARAVAQLEKLGYRVSLDAA